MSPVNTKYVCVYISYERDKEIKRSRHTKGCNATQG